MKLSVIIPHYKRAALLEKTLIQYVILNDAEILAETEFIVIDDSGNQDPQFWETIAWLQRSCPLNIKAFSIDEGTRNPVIPLNFGIRQAQGEYIVITHPECTPITPDCLTKIYECMNDKTFLVGACYSMSEANTVRFLANDWPGKFSPRCACFCGDDGWYEHSQYNPRGLYFLVCVPRQAVLDMGGLDEDYATAHAYDDDDFRDRCVKSGLQIVRADDIVCLHLWHFDKQDWHTKEGSDEGKRLYESKRNTPIVRNADREWGVPKREVVTK